MSFAAYEFRTLLNLMGWPRKAGFLRKRFVVDVPVANKAADLVKHSGLLIGADAPPEIGIALILNEFDEIGSEEDLISLLNEITNQPNFLGNSNLFVSGATQVPFEAFGEERFLENLSLDSAGALWLGLTKPQQVAERIDTLGRSQYEDELFRAGLKGSAHSREEILQAALDIVSAYEAERKKLKDAPPPLLNYINEQRSSEKA